MTMMGAMRFAAGFLLVSLAVVVPPAAAVEPAADEQTAESSVPGSGTPPLGMFIGAKVGAAFRQPFSRLGTAVAPELELGKLLWQRRLVVLVQLGYTRDVLRGGAVAGVPSMPAGATSWKVTEWDMFVSLGLLYRREHRRGAAHAGAVATVHVQESRSQGYAGGLLLGDTRERGTAFGAAVLAGIDLNLGPGALVGEGEASWVALDHRITGSTNLGALTARLGYRIYF